MRALGLDLGEKRIGLAVSDAEGRIAFPAGFLERTGRRRDLAALVALVRERGIACAVVGLPLHMDGRRGPEAAAAEAFATALAAAAGIPVELLDERWTSVAAERALVETGRGGRRRRAAERRGSGGGALQTRGRGEVDAIAAALLLSTWLERRRAREDTG